MPPPPIQTKTWLPFRYTAVNDNPFSLTITDNILEYADIFVFDNDCYMGDATDQDIDISAGDIYHIDKPINIKEVLFKNKVAAANTRIVIAGVPMTQKRIKDAGLI